MFSSLINASVQLSSGTMDYIRFGSGKQTLVMLPGLGESLASVKGTALPTALLYRHFSKAYTVYMFSRKVPLPLSCSTRQMAQDLKEAFDLLGIHKCHLFGVSMGGMIAQHFAADYPSIVDKLVLCATSASPNQTLTESIDEWMMLAQRNDHAAFMDSNLRRIYSAKYYRNNRWLIPFISMLTKPKSYERFFIQAEACLCHNALNQLSKIAAPTLVIGGEQDCTLSPDASREIAAALPNAQLKMYPDWGHGVYEEAKDFCQVVLDFLR